MHLQLPQQQRHCAPIGQSGVDGSHWLDWAVAAAVSEGVCVSAINGVTHRTAPTMSARNRRRTAGGAFVVSGICRSKCMFFFVVSMQTTRRLFGSSGTFPYAWLLWRRRKGVSESDTAVVFVQGSPLRMRPHQYTRAAVT